MTAAVRLVTAVSIWRSLIIGSILIVIGLNGWWIPLLLILGGIIFVWLVKTAWIPQVMTYFRRQNQALPDEFEPLETNRVQITIAYILTVILYFVSNYLLLVFSFDFSWTDATLFIAFFSISWVAGVVAFVMPAGIGVREVVFVFLATQFNSGYSIETLTTIAIIYRFWQIFHEVGGVLIGFSFRQWSKS